MTRRRGRKISVDGQGYQWSLTKHGDVLIWGDAARDIRECDAALDMLNDLLSRLGKGGTLILACESGS